MCCYNYRKIQQQQHTYGQDRSTDSAKLTYATLPRGAMSKHHSTVSEYSVTLCYAKT